jgi:hypothetical protein
LLSLLDIREGFGSWCQSRPKYVYYTLVSSKLMEIFVTLNAAQVAVWMINGSITSAPERCSRVVR